MGILVVDEKDDYDDDKEYDDENDKGPVRR